VRRRAGLSAAAAASVVAALVAVGVLVPAAPASADQVRDLQYWLDEYGITDAWQTTRGDGVTVAVIDTGIDASHPDLRGAVVGGTDVSGVGSPDGLTPIGADDDSHGTLVASLVAGRGNAPGDGVIGVAPAASLLSVSVGFGIGDVPSDTQIAEAVRWSVDHGADVINMSLTRNTLDWPESWDDAFLYAMEHDVVVVAAAGNRGSGTTTVGAPATMPGVLTVAGVDRGERASFDASSQGITIAVSAPSEELVGALPDGGYATWAGTSGAAPLVSGVVALVRAAHPELDAANVIQRVLATARPVGDPVPGPIYGYGIVDAEAAVTADVARVDANPMGDLAEWVRLYRRADVVEVPEVSASAVPGAEPEDVAPEASGPLDPIGALYPGVEQLRTIGIPVAVVGVFGVAAVWVLVAGLRLRPAAPRASQRRTKE
jgi:type VII secretion-associated serine protease mycosin